MLDWDALGIWAQGVVVHALDDFNWPASDKAWAFDAVVEQIQVLGAVEFKTATDHADLVSQARALAITYNASWFYHTVWNTFLEYGFTDGGDWDQSTGAGNTVRTDVRNAAADVLEYWSTQQASSGGAGGMTQAEFQEVMESLFLNRKVNTLVDAVEVPANMAEVQIQVINIESFSDDFSELGS